MKPTDEADKATERPSHPLVIDRHTNLARLATQTDIHRMEAICAAYDVLLSEAKAMAEKFEAIRERSNHAF